MLETYGVSMGFPLSRIVADLVQKLESDILNKFTIKPIFYYIFVDDIALSAPCLKDLLHMFNSFHPRLRFTMEIEGNTLNFLDLLL